MGAIEYSTKLTEFSSNKSNTRKSVSSGKTQRSWVENMRRSRVILYFFEDCFRGLSFRRALILDETLFQVSNIASQTVSNYWINLRQTFSEFMLMKTGYKNYRDVSDFFSFQE